MKSESSKVFYAGKNIFPFNAKIDSLDGKFQHDISEVPIELEEYGQLNEHFDMIRAGDEHFVVVNEDRDKLYGWGFNSHYQLAEIDSADILKHPDVFFHAADGETIKLLECGKLSTCFITGMC
jgi:alpha-tubulin suppressor-like RCC1 family protein